MEENVRKLLTVFLLLLATLSVLATSGARYPVAIEFADRDDAARLVSLGLDVDYVSGNWMRVYVNDEEFRKVELQGYAIYRIKDGTEGRYAEVLEQARLMEAGLSKAAAAYHTYDSLGTDLQNLANAYPTFCKLQSAGKSYQNRDLWVLKITKNVNASEDKPEVRFISSIHGNEVVGMELCVNLAHLLCETYSSDASIRNLVDNEEIWIMPLMNPDGFVANTRENAQGNDLNRSFPDRLVDDNNTTTGRPTEVQDIMNFFTSHTPTLSANLHGGTLVVNYPWDVGNVSSGTYAACPDDDVFIAISKVYSQANSRLWNSTEFTNGITNGSDWYAVNGGMQDWNYNYEGDLHVTIELDNDKWPDASRLPTLWTENRQAMLNYLGEGLKGVRGVVTDAATGQPVAAKVTVVGRDMAFYTDPVVGDYHRRLLNGTYSLKFEATGYTTRTVSNVVVTDPNVTRVDVQLQAPSTLELAGNTFSEVTGNHDSRMDQGETWAVALTVRNKATQAASGVSAAVTETSGGVEIIDSAVALPTIPAGGTASTAAPHVRFLVKSTAVCGSALAFHVSAAGSEIGTFAGTVGSLAPRTLASTDVPKSIPDNNTTGIKSVLNVTDTAVVKNLSLRLDITHTYVGDLTVKLKSPQGTSYTVWNKQGGSADNINQDFTITAFEGQALNGTWELSVVDSAAGDTGTLTGWSLTSQIPACSPFSGGTAGDVNGDGTVNASDLVLLAQYLAGMFRDADITMANADLNGVDGVDVVDLELLHLRLQ